MQDSHATPDAGAGYTNADDVRHMAGEPGAAPPPTAPSAPAQPPELTAANYGISEAQLRDAYAFEVAHGRLSQADADRMLREDLGLPADAPVRAGAQQADEVDSYLAEIGFPVPKTADEYELPRFDESLSPREVVEQAQLYRGMLHEARLPKGVGEFIAQEIA